MDITEFNEIRPYYDEELPQILEELIADQAFQKAACSAIPNVPFELLAQKIRTCKTKLDFQKTFCYGILWKIAQEHTDSLTLDHTALPNKEKAYTYMSNHRDIILDSGFLSILLVDEGMDTVEIAIGDNLLIYPWIKKLVRVNKSFIVQRALTMRQMLESSARMSRYMHYTIAEKNQSIWIAQREGRAKDSNDRTEGYKKTTQDDLINMETGLFGYKGRVHFQMAPCINDKLEQLDRSLPKPDLFARISTCIDQRIHSNYRMYPGNYIAYDWLKGKAEFEQNYTQEEKLRFIDYVEQQLGKIKIPNKDVDFLREKLLLMYANPLINYLAARQ